MQIIRWTVLFSALFCNALLAAAELPTTEVARHAVDQTLRLDAVVEAVHQSTLAAQTSGQIEAIYVDAGDLVPAGTELLRINDRNQRAELEAAQAALAAARAELDDATTALKRTRSLFEKKLASKQSLDSAEAHYNVARAQTEAAEARVKSAREQLAYTVAIAPYTGIVLERHVNLGEVVAPGTPLFTGTSLDALRVVTQIPQNDMPRVRQYMQATVTLPDGTRLVRQGDREIRFFAYASPQTATFKVRVNLPEKLPDLYPGMLLKTEFKIGEREALTIPAQAVVARAELRAVYVLAGDGSLRFRQIRTGRQLSDGQVEVLSGLEAGERVVTEPARAIALLSDREVIVHDAQ